MKRIKIGILFAVCLSIFCSENKNPISPSTKENQYLGGIGTERTYKESVIWLDANTNLPYFDLPDSLIPYMSISGQQIKAGTSFIRDYTEIVEPISDDFYSSWELEFPAERYRQTRSRGMSYSLAAELDSLSRNKSYSLSNFGIGQQIFLLTHNALMSVHPNSEREVFLSVPILKNSLEIDDTWICEQFINKTNNKTVYQTFAEVVTQENIQVLAGYFDAFKIKKITFHYDPDYTIDEGYEYYVPNVGLVLKVSDMNLYRWCSDTNKTIHFREITRKELVSYKFVQ